ncbi:hypothetical protein WMY93_019073 [Mugilogobius chulae]|uniref:Immunoglobulin V-set domain-containing protein n=1 Tax=Mugilogobius chulae TaxID=88201 RepID=A0AAW0NI21_9GOBI
MKVAFPWASSSLEGGSTDSLGSTRPTVDTQHTPSSGEISLTQTPKAAAVDKGASVTLRCQTSSGVGDWISWYLQKGTESPKPLIYAATSLHSGVSSRISGSSSAPDGTEGCVLCCSK